MTDQYEIREDETNPFYPFGVVKNGRTISRLATRSEAEAMIERANEPFSYDIPELTEALDKYEGKGLLLETEQKETENIITIDSQETVGSIIEFHGDKWQVVSSEYITEREATDIEEVHDAYIQPGWNTVIKKIMNEGDAVVVTGSGYGIIIKQDGTSIRVRFLTGTEEDVDSRYVEPASPSMTEKIKKQSSKGA